MPDFDGLNITGLQGLGFRVWGLFDIIVEYFRKKEKNSYSRYLPVVIVIIPRPPLDT